MFALAFKALRTFLGNQLNTLSYMLSAALIASLGLSASLKMEVWSLESEVSTCKSDKEKIAEENSALQSDKARYEGAIVQGNHDAKTKQDVAEKVITKENIVYKDRIKYIKEYVHDGNKTECENALAILMRNGM